MSHTVNNQYSSEDLKNMSQEDLARLGTEMDGVTIAYRKERFPITNDPAEKRASRTVGFWLVLGIICALAFLAIYLFWPWEYKGLGQEGMWWYTFYTPLLGVTMGLSIISLAIATALYIKRFIPEEIAVQERHDGPSDEVDQRTLTALLNDSWETSSLGRRKVLKGLFGTGAVLAGISIIAPLGGMIKNPWKPGKLGIQGDGTLWTSGWSLLDTPEVEKIYLGRDTGIAAEKDELGNYHTNGLARLVRVRPEDLAAGGMETVFPLLPEAVIRHGDKTKDVYEEHMHSIHGPRNAVMLIRLRSEDANRVVEREGQEDYHFGDYYAYSKICTHIGCPTSLYEAQTNRILCPCHQSQFDALHYGKPVFGPAARALPQLPITVDEEGYLVATRNFSEPVGPAFWERES